MTDRYICIHGHFYQPPRENPWLEAIEVQDSAVPYHDWNARVTAECYAPNATSRILDDAGDIVQITNNYAGISFNFGPTLLAWLAEKLPDPQAEESFLRSKLDWNEMHRPPHDEMFAWHRCLIRLRRAHPALTDGRMDAVDVRFDEAAQWLTLIRGTILVVCNFAGVPRRIPCPGIGEWRLALISAGETPEVEAAAVRLESHAVAIFTC